MQESVAKLKRIIRMAMGAFSLAGVVVVGASIYEGATEVQRLIIGKDLLKSTS